jgi:uncharacterized glyoxalase superfamily protein PhnB
MWSRQDLPICYECLDYLNGRRVKQIAILGGLKPLSGHDPVFHVHDVPRAVEHYQRLGFTIDHHDDTYAFAKWGDLVIHLALDDRPDVQQASELYLHVDDADELAAQWRAAGVAIVDPENQDYGKREGRHVDPDGNVIRFGGPPTS